MQGEKKFDNLAWWLYRGGLRPDHLTILQAPIYGLMLALAYRAREGNLGLLFWFGLLQVVVVVIDGADGILARRTGTASRRGYLLDALFDILGIGITLWSVNLVYPRYTNWVLVLLVVNFLVYAQNEIQGTKSVTYTRGPATVGLYLERWYPGILLPGLLLPLFLGLVLMVTRVDWRRRLWNYYQFFTAGRRHEYKAVPKEERARLRHGNVPPRDPEAPPGNRPPRRSLHDGPPGPT